MARLLGIDPRVFYALVRAFILMDLRGQHYASATASQPMFALSPVFIVVGQFLTCSALACAFLYGRVDVLFFAFANLSMGMLLLGTSVLVEFQEVALNPSDLPILATRPIPPRTYAAARLANLLFYFVLMFLSLTIIPAACGATLRDAGWWYAPAYVVASLAGNLVVLCVVVLILASLDKGDALRTLKLVLGWVQIILIMVLFYGGQLLARGGFVSLQIAASFPPESAVYYPTYWLARFVESASYEPSLALLGIGTLLLLAGLICCAVVALRLSGLYGQMQPVEQATASLPMSSPVGGLSAPAWLVRSPEERVGYWMCLTFLKRDANLTMRCLFAFQLTLVVTVLGLIVGKFENPMTETEPEKTMLTVLAVFLLPSMGAPNLVFNLAYSRDSAGGWVLRTLPVARPLHLARGACKAVMLWVVTPICVGLAIAAGIAWRDPVSATLHALLAWSLTWAFLLASLWVICPGWPFSLPPTRGGGLALPPLPMLGIGLVAGSLGILHAKLAFSPIYWIVVFIAIPIFCLVLAPLAERRLIRLGRPT